MIHSCYVDNLTQRETDTDNENKMKIQNATNADYYLLLFIALLNHMSENMKNKHVSIYGGAVISDQRSLIAYNRKRYCP